MPTLEFKGKPFVYSHHLSAPFRELIVDAKKSYPGGKKASLDDNLIIHGDNLEALKALLPRYAGKVDVIYIDPPYNTGNEGWAYNDNVNSPLMKEWLGKVVDRDDLERHDKWLCMMWPRLQLLKDLLSEAGVIMMSIDDNSFQYLRLLMDEIFGEGTFVATIVWQKRYSRENREAIGDVHEYILVCARDPVHFKSARNKLAPDEKQLKVYKNPNGDPRGRWRGIPMTAQGYRKNQMYPITTPSGVVHLPPEGRCWSMIESEFQNLLSQGRIYFGKDNSSQPSVIRYIDEIEGFVPWTWWPSDEAGHTDEAKKELYEILGRDVAFSTPKPVRLITRLLEIATTKDALVLDSFAGSGTTAHSVLALNRSDGGSRRFILVETEDYADTLTAERVRRVIKGVPNAKDEALKKGLGGSFTYCELGEPLDLKKFFEGKGTPSYEQVARYVIFTATGSSVPDVPKEPRDDWFAGEAGGMRVHLIYRPDLAFMRGNDAALSREMVKAIKKSAKGKPVLVFAAQKFMPQKELSAEGITFCQLPYAVYRILGSDPDAA